MAADAGSGWRLASLAAAAALLIAAPESLAETAARGTVARCAGCHGTDGNSTREGIPSLAGQPAVFLETQLVLFREGLRRSAVMGPEMAGMDDTTIVALARHFAALTPVSPLDAGEPALLSRGRSLAQSGRCGICHLPDFSGRAQIPRLAGQREDYLITTLTAYREEQRIDAETTMNEVMSPFSDTEIRALAHFLARQAPRARTPES